jgi:long-chain acyl-CoA synthetase
VQEACVVGKPHSYRGEVVKAYVVPKPGTEPVSDELIAYCAERLTKYKVPTEITLIEALPKTAVGKVLRRHLREKEQANP